QRGDALPRCTAGQHVGHHRARAHGVDSDVARTELARKVAGQAEQAGLRCRVVAALKRTRASAGQRCDIDDGPTALEVPRGSLRAEERPFEVDRQDAVPVSFGQLLQLTPLIYTRVVDQDVQPAKLRDRKST